MSDLLRTRVAREIESHGLGWIDNGKPDIARCHCGYRPQRLGESWHFHVADAVIRELGLREQTGNDAAAPQVIPCVDNLRTHHRYVTEWTADE